MEKMDAVFGGLCIREIFWYTLDCMQGKVFTGVFTQ